MIVPPRASAAPVAAPRTQQVMGPPSAVAARESGEEQLFVNQRPSRCSLYHPLPHTLKRCTIFKSMKSMNPTSAGRQSSRSLHDLLGRRLRQVRMPIRRMVSILSKTTANHMYASPNSVFTRFLFNMV